MKKSAVEINGRYTAKVSGKITMVKILCERALTGGWTAINCWTGRKVHIRSSQKLRNFATDAEWEVLKYDLKRAGVQITDRS